MFGANSGLRKAASVAISLALFLVLGGPWAVLQTVAWTNMVIDYAQQAPVSEALAKTFDGNHPCGLCKKITKAKESERTSPLVIVPAKKEGPFLAVTTIRLSFPDSRRLDFISASCLRPGVISFRPDVPVPKA